MQSINALPDICVVLLANNVSIRSHWICDCVTKMMEDPSISAVVPVYQDNNHHPLRAKMMGRDGMLVPYEENQKEVSTNRQDLTDCYFLVHNFWVLNVHSMMQSTDGQAPWKFMGKQIVPFVVTNSADIHDGFDIEIAKQWVLEQYTD
jgi:hypothetical protein